MLLGAFYVALRFARRAAILSFLVGSFAVLANTLAAGAQSFHVGGGGPTFDIPDFGRQWYSQANSVRRQFQNVAFQFGFSRHPDDNGRVVHVADGDTFTVQLGGKRTVVRILSVDTPETKKPNTPVQCYGPAASSHTKKALLHKRVTLSYDRERTDRYGRMLAYVSLGGKDFGASLLRQGFARTLFIKPNTSRAAQYRRIERQAKAKRRGLWGAC